LKNTVTGNKKQQKLQDWHGCALLAHAKAAAGLGRVQDFKNLDVVQQY
jgi:hypothetical protein